jgi:hypothetical protein
MQIVDESVQAPAQAKLAGAAPATEGVAAELWLAATVLIAAGTVAMLGALSYVF